MQNATTGAKARIGSGALRGAEAPLFHGTARAVFPPHCANRSSKALHEPLFHGTARTDLPRRCTRRSSTALREPIFQGAARTGLPRYVEWRLKQPSGENHFCGIKVFAAPMLS